MYHMRPLMLGDAQRTTKWSPRVLGEAQRTTKWSPRVLGDAQRTTNWSPRVLVQDMPLPSIETGHLQADSTLSSLDLGSVPKLVFLSRPTLAGLHLICSLPLLEQTCLLQISLPTWGIFLGIDTPPRPMAFFNFFQLFSTLSIFQPWG